MSCVNYATTGSGSIEFDEFLKMMTQKILNRDPKVKSPNLHRIYLHDREVITPHLLRHRMRS